MVKAASRSHGFRVEGADRDPERHLHFRYTRGASKNVSAYTSGRITCWRKR